MTTTSCDHFNHSLIDHTLLSNQFTGSCLSTFACVGTPGCNGPCWNFSLLLYCVCRQTQWTRQWASCRKWRWIPFAKHWTFMILLFSSSGPHHPAVGSPRTNERQKPRTKLMWLVFYIEAGNASLLFCKLLKRGEKNDSVA